MPMRLLREDSEGIYIQCEGNKYRPCDNVSGLSHACNTGDPGLVAGEKVNSNPAWGGGSQCLKLITSEGNFYWASEYRLEQQRASAAMARVPSPELDALFGRIRTVKVVGS